MSFCHRLELRKYERIPVTHSHERELELGNMSNNLYGVNAANLSLVVKNQLETRLDDVQATIASLVEAPVPPKH